MDRRPKTKIYYPLWIFGNSTDNIVEIRDFLTIEERKRLMDFALNNKIWDITETHRDKDGLVLYDHKVWENRVCTYNSLMASDPSILELIYSMIARLKIEVDAFLMLMQKKLVQQLLDGLLEQDKSHTQTKNFILVQKKEEQMIFLGMT